MYPVNGALDIGGTKIMAGLVDEAGQVYTEHGVVSKVDYLPRWEGANLM